MTGLQEAFYIMAIVYMGITLLFIFGILIGIGIIRQKIMNLENMVKEKLETVTYMGSLAGEAVSAVKKITKRRK